MCRNLRYITYQKYMHFDMFHTGFCMDLKRSDAAFQCNLQSFEVFQVGFCNDLKCFEVFGGVFEVF